MSLEILTQPAQFNSNVSVLSSIQAADLVLTYADVKTLYNPVTATGTFILLSINGVQKALQLWDFVPEIHAIRFLNSSGDGNWANLANWTDERGRSPVTFLPLGEFNVEIYGDITQNTDGNAEIYTCSFYDTAKNYITLKAFSSFTFKNGSSNLGTLEGNVTFFDNSSNSSEFGTTGVVTGNANFYNNSSNTGIIEGNSDVWYPVPLPFGGNTYGTITYHGYPVRFVNTAGDGDWSNIENWTDDTGIPASSLPDANTDVKIYDKVTKVSSGQALANNADFFATAALEQVTLNVSSSAIFHGSTYNFGNILGNAKFLDTSTNGSTTETVYNTPLHLHFNGVNGSDSFPDASVFNHTITLQGSPYISNEHGVFGGPGDDPYNPPSLYVDGSSSITSIPTGDEYKFGTNDFTIEFWVYPTQAPATAWTPIFCLGSGGGGQEIRIGQNINGSNNFGFVIPNNSNNGDTYPNGSNILELNNWTHLALVRNGSTVTLYADGFVACSQTGVTFDFTNGGPISIGYGFYTIDGHFTGYIDELRVVNGKAIYTEEFNVPVQPLENVDATVPIVYGNVAFANTSLNVSSVSGNASFNNNAKNGEVINPNQNNTLELLMHFDDINGSTTFTDSSDNNINFNQNGGSPIISTSEYEFGGSSLYLDGNSYLGTSNNGEFTFGSNDLTYEAWIYLNAYPVSDNWPYQWYDTFVVLCVGSPSAGDGFNLCIGQTEIFCNNSDAKIAAGTHNMSLNTWYHVAAVKYQGTVTTYVNGVSKGSQNVGSVGGGSIFSVGSETLQGAYFNGYIDEVRVLNGQAAYTSNFTPPTAPFTLPPPPATKAGAVLGKATFNDSTKNANGFVVEAQFNGVSVNSSVVSNSAVFTGASTNIGSVSGIANFYGTSNNGELDDTELLMHFDESNGSQNFVDSSTYNRTFNWNGNPYISNATSVFGGTSLYIDGYSSSIYPSSNGGELALGTDDFTIEFWVYPENTPFGNNTCVILDYRSTGNAIGLPVIYLSNFAIQFYDNGVNLIGGGFLYTSTWYHIAVTRNGTSTKMFINGTQTGSTYNDTKNYQSSTNRPLIGNSFDGYPFAGYIDELRIVKGKAIYTSNFTPPTAPLSVTTGIPGFVGDLATFNDYSHNNNGIENAVFNNFSYNNGSITNGTFYNTSYNNGLVASGVFYDTSYNAIAGIVTYGVFQEDSRNYGYTFDAHVYYPSHYPIEGGNGTVTYYGYVLGCTDPNATNYDPNANINDGSCTYPTGGLTQNIFSYWKLDELTTGTREDATPNGNDLLDPNNNVTSGDGKVNKGAQFNQTYLELN